LGALIKFKALKQIRGESVRLSTRLNLGKRFSKEKDVPPKTYVVYFLELLTFLIIL
jgi:hypothetical protein